MKNLEIEIGSDFSGVGAFDYAVKRIFDTITNIFACDNDKFARESYIANHGEPNYYPWDVYDRDIPSKSLGIYMTSPPCQSFSLAGKRKGKNDLRGILFFNSHEFIKKNKPRYFIFENVKGLLSDNNGQTFNEWIGYLGGKSVNGAPVIFPYEKSVPYHIYHKVLNSKKHGVPQNRERVFIIGIRDDSDNNFTWPKEEYLTKKLKDVLEQNVAEKYFLSDKMVAGLITSTIKHEKKGTGFKWKTRDIDGIASCLRANAALCKTDNTINVGYINQNTQASKVFSEDGTSPTISAGTHGYANGYVNIKSATKKGFEKATENDSINFPHPNSKTRRGRVGKGVAQTLDTSCNQGIIQLNDPKHSNDRVYSDEGSSPTLNTMQGGNRQPFVCIPVLIPDRKEKRQNGRRFKENGEEMFTITTQDRHGVFDGFRIRKLTPRECFRLQDFPESHKLVCSDSQSYKQAGNSITVRVLELIIRKLKF